MSVLEMVAGAKVNFENFAKQNTHLPIEQHPMWMIAMSQLDEVIEELEKGE